MFQLILEMPDKTLIQSINIKKFVIYSAAIYVLIKEIGLETKAALEQGEVDRFGELLHVHWETKKKRSPKMTDPFIDRCYETARQNGALGGKLIGAGGGGFFMFYCANSDKPRLYRAMCQLGLKPTTFNIDYEGTKILVNM